MRRAVIILAMAFLAGCGSTGDYGIPVPNFFGAPPPTATSAPMATIRVAPPTATSPAPSFQVTVMLDPSLAGQDTSLTSAWTAYAEARAAWIEKNVSPALMAQAGYHRSFDEEVAGRTALAQTWKVEKQAEPKLQNIYLDQLLQIYEAYFIREYTWTYYADPTWEQPKGLDMTAFTRWMKANMKRVHLPQTLAEVDVTVSK